MLKQKEAVGLKIARTENFNKQASSVSNFFSEKVKLLAENSFYLLPVTS